MQPPVEYLESVATAIINGQRIKGMAFCMTTEDNPPYVSFQGDAGPEMVLAMMRYLEMVKKMREAEDMTNEDEEADHAAAMIHCSDPVCVVEVGHSGPHYDADGREWWEPD